jgi:hypothetical protein
VKIAFNRCLVADCLRDLLRVQHSSTGLADHQIVELLARFAVVLTGLLQMEAVALLVEKGQQGREGRFDISDDPEVDRSAVPQILGPDVDLCNADVRPLRVELAIWKVGA